MVEEATAACHMLNTDAGKLAELVAHFRLTGGSTAPAPAIPAPQPAPCAAPETSSGNAARNLWQDF